MCWCLGHCTGGHPTGDAPAHRAGELPLQGIARGLLILDAPELRPSDLDIIQRKGDRDQRESAPGQLDSSLAPTGGEDMRLAVKYVQ